MKKIIGKGIIVLIIEISLFINLNGSSMEQLKNNIPEYIKEFTSIYQKTIKNQSSLKEMLKGVELSSTLVQILDNKKGKMLVGLKGFKIAEKIRKEHPQRVEGWYYSALLLGLVAVYKGPQFVLYDIPKIEEWTLKAIETDPGFKKGAPGNLACAIYYEAPGFPISIWSLSKAKKYCEMVRKKYPTNCTNYLYLAAIYDIEKGKEAAKQVLYDAINNCKAPDNSIEEKVWLKKDLESAKTMLDKLNTGKSIRKFMEER